MGWHKRFGGRHHGHHGYGRRGFFRQSSEYSGLSAPPLGKPKPILWILVIVGIGFWSLLAWIAYGVVEPFFGWVAANAGPFASGLGVGGIGGFFGQMSAWLQSIAKPAIVIVWAVGALALLAAPIFLPAMIRLRGRFHH